MNIKRNNKRSSLLLWRKHLFLPNSLRFLYINNFRDVFLRNNHDSKAINTSSIGYKENS